jgi:superfamily II RNA helicase
LKTQKIHDFEYDAFQLEAIAAIDKNHSVIVSAPTGAGKTAIAEYVTDIAIHNNTGVVYTAPIKALSNQKYRDFCHRYGKEKVGILTGDVVINPTAAIVIMTTEIFRNRLFNLEGLYEDKSWVIFDEVHYLDDTERGTVWEESLIFFPKHLRLLALSATIPNITELAHWIETIHKHPVKTVIETKRPVPLSFRFILHGKLHYGFKTLTKELLDHSKKLPRTSHPIDPMIDHLKHHNEFPAIYFCFSRSRCESLAKQCMTFHFLNAEEREKILGHYEALLSLFRLTGDPHAEQIRPLIERGIAYHHAGVLPSLKEVIERLFTAKHIKLIFTTETFALGINMPARAVLFDELRKFYDTGFDFLKTRDFYQMAGRAGRRGYDDFGLVYSMLTPKTPLNTLKRILLGTPEPVCSQFNSNYATVLHLYRLRGEKILDIYPQSFHHFQSDLHGKNNGIQALKNKIALLKFLSYIDPQKHELTARGLFGCKIYGYELSVTELFMQGFFERSKHWQVSVMLTAMIFEPRKTQVPPHLSHEVLALKKLSTKISMDIENTERLFKVENRSKRFFFHLSEAMRAWMQGAPFEDLHNYTDVDEGEIIRNFRMTLQTLREMKNTPGCSEAFYETISECIQLIKRDEIDPESQFALG